MCKSNIIGLLLSALLALSSGCSTNRAASVGHDDLIQVLIQHIHDFNQHDANGLALNMADDFGWYQIDGGDLVSEADNGEGLTSALTSYFEAIPSVKATTKGKIVLPPYIATIESVEWVNQHGKTMHQSALSVYEIDGQKIKNVWYFPAVKHDKD